MIYHGAYFEPPTVPGTQQFEAIIGGDVKFGLGFLAMRLGSNPPSVTTLAKYRAAGYLPFLGVSFTPTEQILDPAGRAVAYNVGQVAEWMAADARYRMKDTAHHTWNLPSIGGQGSDLDTAYFEQRIDALANGLAAWSPNPIFLNLGREMNGFWYPWSENAKAEGHWLNGNEFGSFGQCYRAIVDRMRARYTALGKPWNVTLVWCIDCLSAQNAGGPNTARTRSLPVSVYPGDAYVDWRGMDAYSRSPTDTFERQVEGCISLLNTGAGAGFSGQKPCGPGKPIFIKETNATQAKNQRGYLANLDTCLENDRFPDVRAVGLFDLPSGQSSPVEDDAEALSIYRTILRRETNPGNAFAGAHTTPIPAE